MPKKGSLPLLPKKAAYLSCQKNGSLPQEEQEKNEEKEDGEEAGRKRSRERTSKKKQYIINNKIDNE